ncbi:MAG: efflux RND transporter permease subunit, partial [Verrucomicrobiota bacterium]
MSEPSTKQSGTIAWFARNPVAANLLLFLICICGIASVFTIQKEEQPVPEINQIRVRVAYLGASPLEIERGICIKIEEALVNVQGIQEMVSTASESFGGVTIEVRDDANIFEVMDEVTTAVNSIFTFPEDAEKPIISRVKDQDDIIDVQIYGNIDEREMVRVTKEVRAELLALPEISRVDLRDVRDYEISIEVSEDTLREYGIRLSDVANAIRASSIDLPGGTLRTENFDIRVRTDGKAFLGPEFEDITLINTEDGGRITIGDVATVRDGFIEGNYYSTFDGKPSTSLSVYSIEGQSELKIAAAVRDYVAEKQMKLPEGVFLETWADESRGLNNRLNMMVGNLALGALLVMVLLGFFLRMKVAFWVVVGIPVCFLGTIWLMPFTDVSVNMISLFGFILVLGILVDDAIVIGENIYSYVDKHGPSENNVIAGAREVAMPATFGVLTTVAAFIPMTQLTGGVSHQAKAIGVVVVLALLFSLVESKWILPAHLMSLGREKSLPKEGILGLVRNQVNACLQWFIDKIYRPVLVKVLQYRYATFAGFIALLTITVGAVMGGKVRYVFFPTSPSEYLSASVRMEKGVSFADLQAVMARMDTSLQEIDAEIQAQGDASVINHTRSWMPSRSSGTIIVELSPSETRERTSEELSRIWSERIGRVPGVEDLNVGGNDGASGIGLNLVSEDLDVLKDVSEILVEKLRTYEGVFYVGSGLSDGPPEAVLKLKPEAEAMNLSLADVASQARAAFFGIEVQRVQRGEDEVKVMVRYPEADRQNIDNLENMYFRTRDGQEIPFSAVVEFDYETGYSSIRRVNGKRAVSIFAEADNAIAEPSKISSEINQYFIQEIQPQYPSVGYEFAGGSQEEREILV